MSSVYSSVRTSRRPSRVESPSSFTPPEYHFDDYEQSQERIDLDKVYHKLEKYQSELRYVEARQGRQRSFSSKEVEEVAAATRFKLDLEKLEQFDFEDEEEDHVSRTDTHHPAMPPPRTSSMHPRAIVRRSTQVQPALMEESEHSKPLRRRTQHRPDPIVVPSAETMPQEVQSATLPHQNSSRPVRESDPHASVKTHRRHITISEGRGSARNVVLMSSPSFSGAHKVHELPPLPSFPDFILPALSPSSSTTTAKFSNPPATPLSLCPPNEDQIRREIELFTLRDGGETLVGHQYKHRTPPELDLESDSEDVIHHNYREILKLPKRIPDDDARSFKSTKSISSIKSLSQKRKSIFSVFQRKSEVEKLLDLYLGDDEPEEKPMKRRQSLARRMTRSRRNSHREKPPEIPPMPPIPLAGSYRPG